MDGCRAEHIGVGSEILLGQISNSHAQTISQVLANHGLYLYYHGAVGDNLDRICESFAIAVSRSNVVIITGGLGPTDDDLTREALAAHLGRPLRLSETALAEVEIFFTSRHRQMPEENRKQAMCIEGGEFLPNPNGTAPGQYVESDGVHYFLLPGPPLEMRPMLAQYVLPRLQQIFPARQALVSRLLHFCGIGESDVDEQIRALTAQSNPTVAPLAAEGEMLLRITATDESVESARERIEPVEMQLRAMFPSFIYGVDEETLPVAVGKVLQGRTATLAVAESCTGGMLSSMITAVPGASTYFRGGVVVYADDVKTRVAGVTAETLAQYGAVSEEVARELADGIRTRLGADYGLSVTGVAGPSGGTPDKPVGLVFGAVSGPDKTYVYRMQFRGSREQIRIRTAKQMLWRLWTIANQGQ